FERDPGQQRSARQLNAGDPQQHCGNTGENDAEEHGDDAAEKDCHPPLLQRKTMRGHSDDDGIVAAQHEIDQDNSDDGVEKKHYGYEMMIPPTMMKAPPIRTFVLGRW